MILLFVVSTSKAQVNQEKLEQAFAQSYQLEGAKSYLASIDVMKQVYDRSSYEINLRLGWLYYLSGRFDESVTYYSRALQLKPYSEEARNGLILPKTAQGYWNEVVEIYAYILENNPNNTVAMFRLGMVYYERRSYDKALPLFKKVVDLYPFDYDGLLMLGWTCYFTGNYNHAKVLFNKVKLHNPDDESANQGLQLIK